MGFKDISNFSSGGHLVYRFRMSKPILEGSHLGNIPLKSESNWPKGLRGIRIQKIINGGLFLALKAILYMRAEIISLFW